MMGSVSAKIAALAKDALKMAVMETIVVMVQIVVQETAVDVQKNLVASDVVVVLARTVIQI